jgi:hypothetical protein
MISGPLAAALVAAIVFVAAVLQALSGFGFALIVMPLVTLVIGLQQAAPLVALEGLTTYTINIVRFRQAIQWKEVMPLVLAAAAGIPIGLWVLGNVDEAIIRPVLGAVLIAYAVYALLRPQGPAIHSRAWAIPAGLLAGCLGGAYNTPGPPVVVYGSLRRWPKQEFRAILQTFFFANGVIVVVSHALAQHLTAGTWKLYLVALPALLAGIAAGSLLDPRVNAAQFQVLVSVLILATGLSLLIKT